MADLHDVLRNETAICHERLEKLPFFSALHDGSLPKTAIVSFLRCLTVIHAILERSQSLQSEPQFAALCNLTISKVPLLTSDLALLNADAIPSIDTAIQAALEMSAEILQNGDLPLRLLGILYVLEGSQNGGAVLKKAYTSCLKKEIGHLSYFGCYGTTTAEHWRGFVRAMNSLVLTTEETRIVCESAIACFEGIEKICTALYPFSEHDLKYHAAAVNFEAGDHVIPQDPLQIALALRAGRKAWKMFPYLETRFGERGKRFTSSDSCWLVALTQLSSKTATERLRWLRSLLTKRGIPSVILDGHLKEISRALKEEALGGEEEWNRFEPFLSILESERLTLDPSVSLSNVVTQYEKRLQKSEGTKIESTAQLIASSWIDENSGIRGALVATQDWFTNADRFSKEWITIVNELIATLGQLGHNKC